VGQPAARPPQSHPRGTVGRPGQAGRGALPPANGRAHQRPNPNPPTVKNPGNANNQPNHPRGNGNRANNPKGSPAANAGALAGQPRPHANAQQRPDGPPKHSQDKPTAPDKRSGR
jgi:hypothetical protein